MRGESRSDKLLPFTATFVSLISIFGIFLFFSGWIYRWAYFSYFNLDVNVQSFMPQSFLIIPIQIYFGGIANILKTGAFILVLPMLILVSRKIISSMWIFGTTLTNRLLPLSVLFRRQDLSDFSTEEHHKLITLLLDETVIVAWLLTIIFGLSQQQGLCDARRDAIDDSSTLPVVTLLLSKTNGVLAQDLSQLEDNNKPIYDPATTDFSFIGDLDLALDLKNTSLSNPDRKEVWRLLAQESGGWLYLVRTMPPSTKKDDRPMVLAIPKASQGQSLILSPEIPKKPDP